MAIILYSDDINLLAHWEKALNNEVYKSLDDIEELKNIKEEIIILNYASCGKECTKILNELVHNNNKILLLDRVPELEKAKKFLKLGIYGYGNALMRDHFILAALAALRENMVWLYPALTSQLILELPSDTKDQKEMNFLEKLTQREKEVAFLLKEGLTYNDIAQKLAISARTVKAHAQSIYSKLDVKDRLGLALLLK